MMREAGAVSESPAADSRLADHFCADASPKRHNKPEIFSTE
jgi:hypothetical protein